MALITQDGSGQQAYSLDPSGTPLEELMAHVPELEALLSAARALLLRERTDLE